MSPLARLFAVLLLVVSGTAGAASNVLCPNAKILGAGMFRNTCWSAMFPVKVAGKKLMSKSGYDEAMGAAQDKFLCKCGGDLSSGKLPSIGTPVGYWQPTKLVELTRKPYCLPSLGGYQMSDAPAATGGARATGGGHGETAEPDATHANVMHFHTYAYPVMSMLKIFDFPTCLVDNVTSFDVAMLSEAFPTWYDTSLAAVLSPEALLFANPVALAAGAADCAAATATSNPIDSLFWVAGCWGGMYPLSGVISSSVDLTQTTSLYATRALFALGRIGMLRRTMGNDVVSGKCEFPKMRIIKKSMFKMQMLYPVPESGSTPVAAGTGTGEAATGEGATGGSGGTSAPEVDPRQVTGQNTCTHPVGRDTMRWGAWRSRPGPGENHVYLVWQWVDCCVGVVGGGI